MTSTLRPGGQVYQIRVLDVGAATAPDELEPTREADPAVHPVHLRIARATRMAEGLRVRKALRQLVAQTHACDPARPSVVNPVPVGENLAYRHVLREAAFERELRTETQAA